MKKEKVLLGATKILIDACCTLLCTPDKAPFEVSIKGTIFKTIPLCAYHLDAIITRSTALLVCEGLRSLFEANSDGLGRSPEMGALISDVRAKFYTPFSTWISGQLVAPLRIF